MMKKSESATKSAPAPRRKCQSRPSAQMPTRKAQTRSTVAPGNDPAAISRTHLALVALLAQQLLTAAAAHPHEVHSHLSHEQNSPLQSGHLQSTQQQEPTAALDGAACPPKPKANVDNATTERGAISAEKRFNMENPSIDLMNEKRTNETRKSFARSHSNQRQ